MTSFRFMSLMGRREPHNELKLSEFSEKRFLVEGRNRVLRSFKLLTVFACIFFPLFGVIDYFMYPDHFVSFMKLRFLCVTFMLIGMYVLLGTKFGRRNFRFFTVVLPLIPGFFVGMMIYLSGDPYTNYYIGMILCMNGIGFLSQWRFSAAVITSSVMLGLFLIVVMPPVLNGLDAKQAINLITNFFYASLFCMIACIGALLQEGVFRREFVAREKVRRQKMDLANKNEQLADTMKELHHTRGDLIQSEKLASMGQLSAGVIHEIGNPLNYSNQALFVLRKHLKGDESEYVHEVIRDIQDSFDRMKTIVSDLREFSHKSGGARSDFSVVDCVQVAVRMLGKEIEATEIDVDVSLSPNLRVNAVKNQITQVFVNLIHNAMQSIEAQADRANAGQIRVIGQITNDAVEVSVIDNGPGIEQDAIGQLFDPFFTTKEAGMGTGLGLSICYRIIEAHEGEITVKSKPGAYTKFTVSLPVVASAPSEKLEGHLQAPPPHENAVP